MSKIAIFGEMKIKPGQMDDMFGRFRVHAQASRAEPGCIRFDLAIDQKDPDTLHFYEIWADQAVLDVHANTARIKAHREATKDMVAERRVAFCHLRDSPDA